MTTPRVFCGDECTCENLKDLKFAAEREKFLKVCNKLKRMKSKMYDFNSLCNSFMSNVFDRNMNKFECKLNYNL